MEHLNEQTKDWDNASKDERVDALQDLGLSFFAEWQYTDNTGRRYYEITLFWPRSKGFKTTYNCGSACKEPTLLELVYCLISDADCYESTPKLEDFLEELDYLNSSRSVLAGIKAYKACKKTYQRLSKLSWYSKARDIVQGY